MASRGANLLRVVGRIWLSTALLGVAIGLYGVSVAHADPVGYQFDLTTNYQFGGCDTTGNNICASPDTGFLTVTNNGASTFVGTLDLFGTFGAGPNTFSDQVTNYTLAPGASLVFAATNEGSNQGGFNGPTGSTQPGLEFEMLGTVSLGANSESVDLTTFDSQIHSSLTSASPCDGLSTNSYVLQGGSPTGCDNTDPFETTPPRGIGQAQFFEAANNNTVPEPSSLVLFLLGAVAVGGMYLCRQHEV
jgi:hypothetical protein